jgi:hypothetical protein
MVRALNNVLLEHFNLTFYPNVARQLFPAKDLIIKKIFKNYTEKFSYGLFF